MDIRFELIMVVKLLVAFAFGAFIGYDREKQGKDAGIRTYAAICFGATLFTAIADEFNDIAAASRIISNIVVGIGFLGAGIIGNSNTSNATYGLTTAATVWCTAAVGVAVGMDNFIIAIVASLMLYFLLSLDRQKWYISWMNKIKSKNDKASNDSTNLT
ncbi:MULTISPECIES: MgtC/SapB family protein [Hydrotalea]|uniref:MgtC/SapB family protein n=1 Tax=Hydrotalea TaxID=1004300 RepID=UPI000829FAFB|nr:MULTISPECIES: MgtC/SapB family protein [Hydrotalea]RTL53351.1 MAG: MgtC/SapB family protein [Sphingobacteriales bacterium]RWZ84911.1 MAG: MgtC/SapB family protein [Hydrotalea sp. AMD]